MEILRMRRKPRYEIITGDKFPICEDDIAPAMFIPSYYLPRDERKNMRDEIGDIVDDVFSDYGEMYIRILRGIEAMFSYANTVRLLVYSASDYSHVADMVSNIAETQFQITDKSCIPVGYNLFNIKTKDN